MSSPSSRCDFCGASIPPSDFEAGRAILLLRKHYCAVCLEKTIQKSKTKRQAHPPGKTPRSRDQTTKTSLHPAPGPLPSFKTGAHTCSLYWNEDERRVQALAYICEGLWQGEKVAYAIDDSGPERLLSYFRKEAIDIQRYLETRQLEIYPAAKVYALGGTFDPLRVISMIQALQEHAQSVGYKGLRVSGEMSWALRGWPGSDQLWEYEKSLNAHFRDAGCTILCQYDRTLFASETLEEIRSSHPVVVSGPG